MKVESQQVLKYRRSCGTIFSLYAASIREFTREDFRLELCVYSYRIDGQRNCDNRHIEERANIY